MMTRWAPMCRLTNSRPSPLLAAPSKPTKSTAGNVDTYTFNGTVELNGKSVNVSNVVITVTKSDDLATGDVVQVKVPAALIPLRSFNVDQDKMTMTVSDTQPINIVYTSSLKAGVEDELANPDGAMTEYLQANHQDGKASFTATTGSRAIWQNRCKLRAFKGQQLLLLHQRHAHLHR